MSNRPPKNVSAQKIAELTGIHHRTIAEWQLLGKIPRSSDKDEILAGVVRHLYEQSEEQDARAKARLQAKSREDVLLAERIRLTAAQADQYEAKAQALRDSLVNAEEAKQVWAEFVQAATAELHKFPSAIAHQVAALNNPAEVQELLTREVYQLLEMLTDLGQDSVNT